MLQRIAFTLTAVTIILLLLRRKILYIMLDPLLRSGLPENDIRLYRYLLAMQKLSTGKNDPTLDVETIQGFIEKNKGRARSCPICQKYYLGISYCTDHHLPTLPISVEKLIEQISAWEAFRRSYVETTSIRGLERTGAIKLYWHTHHKGEG